MRRQLMLILGIFLVGLLATVSGVYLRNYQPMQPLSSTVLEVVGVAFLAVALTAPISEYFQFRTLSRHMQLLQAAQTSGISNIYRSRAEDRDSFHGAIERALGSAHEVYLGGISLPGVFHDPPYPPGIEKVLYDPNIPLKILLLQADSPDAKERAIIEEGRAVSSDIASSIEQIRNILVERAKKLRTTPQLLVKSKALDTLNIHLHTYSFPPIAYTIFTDNTLFLEQYHFGRLAGARVGECIGGWVPVVEFDSGSKTYAVMRSHFDYVWHAKSLDVTQSLIEMVPQAAPADTKAGGAAIQ